MSAIKQLVIEEQQTQDFDALMDAIYQEYLYYEELEEDSVIYCNKHTREIVNNNCKNLTNKNN